METDFPSEYVTHHTLNFSTRKLTASLWTLNKGNAEVFIVDIRCRNWHVFHNWFEVHCRFLACIVISLT